MRLASVGAVVAVLGSIFLCARHDIQSSGYMITAACLRWEPGLIMAIGLSDMITGLIYVIIIPVLACSIVRAGGGWSAMTAMPKTTLAALICFVMSCGLSHLVDAAGMAVALPAIKGLTRVLMTIASTFFCINLMMHAALFSRMWRGLISAGRRPD